MPISPPTYDELFSIFRRQMESLGFNFWEEGSRVGAIGRVSAAQFSDLWQAIADVEHQTNPSTAQGIYLDRFGEMFGVPRIPPQYATTVGKGAAVKFTNNGTSTVQIAAGTRVWSSSDPDLAYFTVNSISLTAGSEGFTNVVAVSVGEEYNVGVGELDSHNSGSQIAVSNVRAIGGGTFYESDAAYRFRIVNALRTRNGATESAIRQELLKIPGVRDIIVHSGVRGNGSIDIILIPIDRYVSNDMMNAAELIVENVVAAGISWKITPPITRRVDVRVQIVLRGGGIIDEVRAQVEAAIRGYIDNLRVNDGQGESDLIYNELVSRVQDASSDILDSIINLFIEGSPTLQANIFTNPGERLVSGSIDIA